MTTIVTKITYEGNGTLALFGVPFEYLSRTHVHVYINNVEILTDFSWSTNYSIIFATPPVSGAVVTIQRITPMDESYVVWQDGTVIVADDLNAQGLQALFINQERQNDFDLLHTFLTSTSEKTAFEENLEDFSTLLKYSPVSFGSFRISADGDLLLDYYGSIATEEMTINDDGELILTVDE